MFIKVFTPHSGIECILANARSIRSLIVYNKPCEYWEKTEGDHEAEPTKKEYWGELRLGDKEWYRLGKSEARRLAQILANYQPDEEEDSSRWEQMQSKTQSTESGDL